MKVLLVEDDLAIAGWEGRLLREEAYKVTTVSACDEACQLGTVETFDLVIIDLHLGDESGLRIIRELRRKGRTVPILVVSGDADEEVIIAALDAGADDYIVKPINAAIFKARIRAAVRRGGAATAAPRAYEGVVLDRMRRQLLHRSTSVALSERELGVLNTLMAAAGATVPRTHIVESVWRGELDSASNALDVTVSRIRRKLSNAAPHLTVESVRGIGFRLVTRR